jgi:hypothetical protein
MQRIVPLNGFQDSSTRQWIEVCPLSAAVPVQAKFRYASFYLPGSELAIVLRQANAPSKGPSTGCRACSKIRERPAVLYLFHGQMELKEI